MPGEAQHSEMVTSSCYVQDTYALQMKVMGSNLKKTCARFNKKIQNHTVKFQRHFS